jgi:hypothetical protein
MGLETTREILQERHSRNPHFIAPRLRRKDSSDYTIPV